jgi:hypothetical protein
MPPQAPPPQVIYVQQPQAAPPMQVVNLPKGSISEAIVVTLCCCLPGGIVTLVYTSQMNSAADCGDVAAYHVAKGKRKFWLWLSLIFGGLAIVLNILLAIAEN